MESRQQQITIRKAQYEDLERLCEIYSEAFHHTKPSQLQWWKIIEDDTQYYSIVEVDGKITGVAALITINKILRSGSRMGLIEDVAIDSEARGLGLGKLLIKHLIEVGFERGCYKIILNCSDTNITFYEKCGFHKAENQMRIDRPKS